MVKEELVYGSAVGVPKFSVIMPACNTGRFVGQALGSLVQQDFQDFEVVFIDDGSTDNTALVARGILSDWGGSFTFLSQKNQGVGNARNIGIGYAKGEYLVFLDSDDMVDPHMLKLASGVADMTSPDVIATGWRRIDENSDVILDDFFYHSDIPEWSPEPSVRVMQFLKGLFPLWIGGFLVKRSLVTEQKIKFFSRLPVYDDVFFMLRCLFYMGSFELIDEELSSYRKRHGSVTLKKGYEYLALKAEIHLIKEAERLFDGLNACPGEPRDYCSKRLTRAYFRRLKFFVLEGRDDLFYLAVRDRSFRNRLSGIASSGSYSMDDRFKAFLALFLPALYCLRYRWKRKGIKERL